MRISVKKKIARKLITPQEIREGVSIFDSAGWKRRKAALAAKQANQGKPRRKSEA